MKLRKDQMKRRKFLCTIGKCFTACAAFFAVKPNLKSIPPSECKNAAAESAFDMAMHELDAIEANPYSFPPVTHNHSNPIDYIDFRDFYGPWKHCKPE